MRAEWWRRLRGNVPLLVTVVLHAVAVLVAAVWVVSETIAGPSKKFEAPGPVNAPARQRLEHRVQVARRASAASAPSAVAAQRIQSTAATGLALPPLPDLAQAGSGFGGLGAGSGLGLGGSGSGAVTALGNGGLGGRGLMSTSFLGLTGVRVERVVFVIDVGRGLMDIRKGGFRAFEIIRAEILRLVGQLPPSAQFGVVLFDDNTINRFAGSLTPATLAHKQGFFSWIEPVNGDASRIGAHSAAQVARWQASGGIDDPDDYRPSAWAAAVQAALELGPETVLLITGTAGTGTVRVSEGEREERERAQQRKMAGLARQGLEPAAVNAARQRALAAAQEQLKTINARLEAQGRPPFVVRSARRFLDADFQAAVRKAGYQLAVDTTGWRDEQGQPIWEAFSRTQTVARASEGQLNAYLTTHQTADGRRPAVLNIFLFTGAEARTTTDSDLLTGIARAQGGKFSLLTSRRLDELARAR